MSDNKKWNIPTDLDFENVKYVCRPCSHEEMHNLWHRWHFMYGVPWKEVSRGRMVQIGTIDNRPITITVWWADIQMQRVAFVDPHSQLVDYAMVDDWCSDVFPGAKHFANPANFHNLLGPIKQASGGILMRDVHEIDKAIRAVEARWVPEEK